MAGLLSQTLRSLAGRPDYFHGRTPLYWALNQERPVAWYLDLRERADWDGPVAANGCPLFPLADGSVGTDVFHGSWWALGKLQRFLISAEESEKQAFLAWARHLLEFAQRDGDALFLPSALPEPLLGLPAGHRGAGLQALAIAVWVRAFDLEVDLDFRDAALAAWRGMLRPVDQGGCAAELNGHRFFAGHPRPGVLHGHLPSWILALTAARDLGVLADHDDGIEIFDEGVRSLRRLVSRWDEGRWSYLWLDDGQGQPVFATPYQHDLHVQLIRIVYRLSKLAFFDEWKERWEDNATSPRSRSRALVLRLMQDRAS